MKTAKSSKQIAFAVTIGNIQEESRNIIGRDLTEKELHIAIKGVECGLSFGIDTVFRTAIEEAVE